MTGDDARRMTRKVKILLEDWEDALPPSGSGSLAVVGDGGYESSFPVSAEGLRRLDPKTLVGETYSLLDGALKRLSREHPHLYSAIYTLYLSGDCGHSDADFVRERRVAFGDLGFRHDMALLVLSRYLLPYEDRLYVRYPSVRATDRAYEPIEDRHHELFAVYRRLIKSGFSHDDALENAILHTEYPSRERAERIIHEELARLD